MRAAMAFQFRLELTEEQNAQCARFAGCCRWVWNRAIGEQRDRRSRGEKHAGYAEMCRWLTAWRANPETAWLREGSASAQQQTLKRLDQAYERFFEFVRLRNNHV